LFSIPQIIDIIQQISTKSGTFANKGDRAAARAGDPGPFGKM